MLNVVSIGRRIVFAQDGQTQLPRSQLLLQQCAIVATGPLRPNGVNRCDLLLDASADVHNAVGNLRPAGIVILFAHTMGLQSASSCSG